MFRAIRRYVEEAIFSLKNENIKKIEELRGAYSGMSVFLVGNAPSLKELPLMKLFDSGVPFALVNNGVRLVKGAPIPFHVVSDVDCFRENHRSWRDLPIRHAFYRKRFLRVEPEAAGTISYPVTWLPYRNGGILKRNFQTDLALGLGNDSNVLCFAAQVFFYLGFAEVYVIGCDLEYQEGNEYAYALTESDMRLERGEETRSKRRSLTNANAEFEVIHQVYVESGRSVFNSGVGGNLHALPRLPFEVAMKRAQENNDVK